MPPTTTTKRSSGSFSSASDGGRTTPASARMQVRTDKQPPPPNSLRNSIHQFVENPQSSKAAAIYGATFEVASLYSCILLILKTFDGPIHGGSHSEFPSLAAEFFEINDLILTVVFTFDFCIRFFTCPSIIYAAKDESSVPFIKSWFNWFDLASIVPWYIAQIWGKVTIVSLLRLCRMLRILKITRNFPGTYILISAVTESIPALKISLVFLSIVVGICGTLIYLMDPCFDKTTCSFTDAFTGAYYVLTTMTTVGYGDVIPSEGNVPSRLLGVMLMVIGTLFLAMPIEIIGTEFNRAWKAHNESARATSKIGVGNYKAGNIKYNGYGDTDKKTFTVASGNVNVLTYDDIYSCDALGKSYSEVLVRFYRPNRLYVKLLNQLSSTVVSMKFLVNAATAPDRAVADKIDLKEVERALCGFYAEVVDLIECRSRLDACVSPLVQILLRRTNSVLGSFFSSQKMFKFWLNKTKRGKNNESRRRSSTKVIESSASNNTTATTTTSESEGWNEQEKANIILHIKKQKLPYKFKDVEARRIRGTFRDKMWLALEIPPTSVFATWLERILRWSLILSIAVTIGETMPEFQLYGESTYFCEQAVRSYCNTVALTGELNATLDPGCFTPDKTTRLEFYCAEKTAQCYGGDGNFGAIENDTGRSCKDSIKPFRNSLELKNESPDLHDVCLRKQCDDGNVTFFHLSFFWIYFEWYFAILFTMEQIDNFYIASSSKKFFKDPVVWIDLISILPFYYEVGYVYLINPSIYPMGLVAAVPPGTVTYTTMFRMFRINRVLKFYRQMPGTHVIYEAITRSFKKLMMPYFLLSMTAIMFSYLLYELEKGTTCYYGSDCYLLNSNQLVSFPESLEGTSVGKRILINDKGQLSRFKDFYSSFWFTMTTISSVGYGYIVPVTQIGKLVTVMAMLFGACYTAMPLAMMGKQFHFCFTAQKNSERLAGCQHAAYEKLVLKKGLSTVYERFRLLPQYLTLEEIADLLALVRRVRKESSGDDLIVKDGVQKLNEKLVRYRTQILRLAPVIKLLQSRGSDNAWEQRRVLADS